MKAGGAALVAAAVVALSWPGPAGVEASGHRDERSFAAAGAADAAGLYAFVSPDDPSTVTLITTWVPWQEPAGGPNFYGFAERVRYDLNIDNDGDARRDITYRWVFRRGYRHPAGIMFASGTVGSARDPNLNFFQTYDLIRIEGGRSRRLADDAPVAPSDVGEATMPDYERVRDSAVILIDGGLAFAGQADDPYFADYRIYDRLYGGDMDERGDDTVAGFNTNVLAIQVSKNRLAAGGDAESAPVIGVWATASQRSVVVTRVDGRKIAQTRYVQVSRTGMPLVGELLVPFRERSDYNASTPLFDALLLFYFDDPVIVRLFDELYRTGVPDTNPSSPGTQRDDLISVYFKGITQLNEPPGVRPSEQLRLNMAVGPCTPGSCPEYSRLGVIGGDIAGFPNGRRLDDDVVDATLQLLMGELAGSPNDLSDEVDANDVAFAPAFPFVALPHRGSDPNPH